MGQVIDTNKYKYDRIKLRGPDGRAHYSANSADAVSKALFGLGIDDMVAVLQDNGLDHVIKHAASKSVGHFRMIVGQTLRAAINKGAGVLIKGREIKTLKDDVPWPEGWAVEPIVRRGTPTPPARITFKDK